jgi:hypothetical protein
MRAGLLSPRVVFWVAVAVLTACNSQQGGLQRDERHASFF